MKSINIILISTGASYHPPPPPWLVGGFHLSKLNHSQFPVGSALQEILLAILLLTLEILMKILSALSLYPVKQFHVVIIDHHVGKDLHCLVLPHSKLRRVCRKWVGHYVATFLFECVTAPVLFEHGTTPLRFKCDHDTFWINVKLRFVEEKI